MSGRMRKPSERMREIAEAHRRQASPPPVASSSSKPKASSSKPKKAKARSVSPGTAALDSYLDFGEDSAAAASTYDSAPGQLFCICLSTDDTTPMIQCEGCENWCVASAVCSCACRRVRQVPLCLYRPRPPLGRGHCRLLLRHLYRGRHGCDRP